ncbi:head-tail connector protein [Lactobacillus acetotolerans]|uniref:head-tail connector protein n=1 Tax=Lactobacillus acetotolerans TaxID=1600 RepID=UPI0007B9A8FD|nr:head-tail connector protein [Lactobacillus acetotolerans]QGV04194.1 phage gp6-like head-tail connector protein [Lactobacillus acetotolerans]
MATISLAEAKTYLRVDSTTEDDLITRLIGSATTTVENVLRQPLSAFDPLPDDIHTAILYTIAYLYEYRETADFDAMIKFLRAILAPYRKEEF